MRIPRRSTRPHASGSALSAAHVGRAMVIGSLALIAFVTLRPSAFVVPLTGPWCLVCGPLGGIDVIQNVVMFLPLGIGLRLWGVPWWRGLVIVVATTFTIELLQYRVISGRDASVSDVLTNTLGGSLGMLVGAHWKTILLPDRRSGLRLAGLHAFLWIAAFAATAVMMRPSIPNMVYWGQVAPRFEGGEPFTGRVLSVTVNGLPVENERVSETERYLAELSSGDTRVEAMILPGEPTRRTGVIGRMLASQLADAFMLGQRGEAAVFRLRLRSADVRLRTPEVALPRVLRRLRQSDELGTPTVDTLVVAGWLRGPVLGVETTRSGRREAWSVVLEPTLGWSLFLPIDLAPQSRFRLLSALWIAAWILPIGFWTQPALTGDQPAAGSERQRGIAWVVALGALVAALGALPLLMRFPSPHWSGWIGGAAGLALGAALYRAVAVVANRRRSTA